MSDIQKRWESDVLPSLSGLIEIPAVSPQFDDGWQEHGHLLRAAEHVRDWIAAHDGLTAEVIRRPGRTPLVFAEAAARYGEDQAASRYGGEAAGRHDKDEASGRHGENEASGRPGENEASGRHGENEASGRHGENEASGRPGEGDAAGRTDRGTVVVYGHLDKQPPLGNWSPGLAPWRAVVRDGRLYGRGAADDGYAPYATVLALAESRSHARTVLLLETSEESGSPDLDAYLTELADRLGDVSLVIGLDSANQDYERLWLTTSLRGAVQANVTVRVLDQPQHSGTASGIVPSSFRIMRQLLDRVEDPVTGVVTVPEMHVAIPDARRDEVKALAALHPGAGASFPFAGKTRAVSEDDAELLLNNTWRPTLSVIGVAGMPDPAVAGAVLRSETTLRLSFRTPPGVPATVARDALVRMLTTDVPYDAVVEVDDFMLIDGWDAPPPAPWLTAALDEIGERVFGKPCVSVGQGGGIPSIGQLADRYPSAQFLVTGAVGPDSNMHALDESLNLAQAYRVTEALAMVLTAHAEG